MRTRVNGHGTAPDTPKPPKVPGRSTKAAAGWWYQCKEMDLPVNQTRSRTNTKKALVNMFTYTDEKRLVCCPY
jgi:hypothetical protein